MKKIINFSCFTCLIVGIFVLFVTSQAMATTYCVANEAELIAALDDATENGLDDVVKIQQGTYYGNFAYASTESFGVTIEGGYSDDLCTVRDVDPGNSILDGEQNGVVLAVSSPIEPVTFVVEGITLQNGDHSHGGGLYATNKNGDITLNNNIITNNSGSGVYLLDVGTVNLVNNTISANTMHNRGGGIYLEKVGTVTLNENTISSNSASEGGGIFHDGGGTLNLTNNTITNNNATFARGGGASFYRAAITLTNNTISYNSSEGLGGGVSISGGTVTLVNNIINNNINTGGIGGGVGIVSLGNVIMNNNIISDNSADNGGGVRINVNGGTIDLTNNTIINNNGGGVSFLLESDSDIANIYNNIIWNNNAVNGGSDLHIFNDGNHNFFPSIVNLYNNDFDQSEDGIYIQIPFSINPSNLNNADPFFVDFANDDYHLTEGSLLINAGNDGAPELPLTDKDGNPRKVGSAVDIGAYEYQGFITPVAAFMASPLVGVAPLTIEFFDESTGSIETWYWDFGDGNDSTLQNPTNTYNVTGTHTVSLTVTGDSVSDTETKNEYITVVSLDAPDLSCKAKEFHSYEFGQRIVVKLQVDNSGNTRADPFDVAFYLSNNGITQDELLGLDTVNGGLTSQHTKVISLRYDSVISLSGKYIISVLDSDGRVLELDETNNTMRIRVP